MHNYTQLDYTMAYLKHNDINKISLNTLFQILDVLTTNKDLFLKYYREKDSKVLNRLWFLISLVSGAIIFKYSKIMGISVGVLLAYSPYFALSKIGMIEYNNLIEELNNTIDEKCETLNRRKI